MQPNCNCLNRRGFTLVELLVVVGIVALLIAILLPTLSSARMAGRRTASMSNMRQLGVGLTMYAVENKGMLPETSHTATAAEAWVYTLKPYISNVDQVRICPADPKAAERLTVGGTSYVFNEYVSVRKLSVVGVVEEDFRKLTTLKKPAETILLFIAADDTDVLVSKDHTHSRGWFLGTNSQFWTNLRKDIQPDRFTTRRAADNTRGSTAMLYADGHVAAMNAAELKQMADAGVNFAMPPK